MNRKTDASNKDLASHIPISYPRLAIPIRLSVVFPSLQLDVCLGHIHVVICYLTLHNVLPDLPCKGTLDSYSAVKKFPKVHPRPHTSLPLQPDTRNSESSLQIDDLFSKTLVPLFTEHVVVSTAGLGHKSVFLHVCHMSHPFQSPLSLSINSVVLFSSQRVLCRHLARISTRSGTCTVATQSENEGFSDETLTFPAP
jgi:hypothetical protein